MKIWYKIGAEWFSNCSFFPCEWLRSQGFVSMKEGSILSKNLFENQVKEIF